MGLKPANLWDTTICADPENVGVGGGGGWEGIYFQVCRGWGARYIFEEFYDVKSLAHSHMVHALI